jgi:hypothetical protein
MERGGAEGVRKVIKARMVDGRLMRLPRHIVQARTTPQSSTRYRHQDIDATLSTKLIGNRIINIQGRVNKHGGNADVRYHPYSTTIARQGSEHEAKVPE